MATGKGMAIRFKEDDVRTMGRSARGVRAINLKKQGDAVVGMEIISSDDPSVLTVTKKGYDTLIDALAQLPADLNWRFEHIGGGTDSTALKQRADRAGLGDRIAWRGAQPQVEVIDLLRRTDLFVLASRVAKSATSLVWVASSPAIS